MLLSPPLRRILPAALVFAAAAALAAAAAPGAASAARPNLVFLLTDDQTARAVGCYGNADVHTPHLDRLAREGVRFTRHYNTTSICMASRVSVLTGLYEYRHGCNFDHGDLDRRMLESAYPARLRAAGYFTGFAGKVGFDLKGEKFEAIASFFDRWAGGPGQTFYETEKNAGIARYAASHPHSSRAYAAWAADFLREARASGKPFGLSISFKAPHLPFTPEPADLARYTGRTFARPPNYGVAHGRHLSAQSRTSRAATGYREWIDTYDRTAALYYALITGVDAAVGMIREALAREGFADDTVIVFTSDNGYSAGAHGFGDKVLPYEEASKSPLIIHDPRLPRAHAGAVSDALTANVDVAPTLLALAGVPVPADLDGRSLVPLLTQPAARVRDHLPLFNFWGVPSAQSLAIVAPGWKYIHWYYAGDGLAPADELFDLAADPYELNNLAADPAHAARLAELRRLYDSEVARLGPLAFRGHGYEPYAVLFDRTVAWDRKAPLVPRPASTAKKNKKAATP